MCQCVLSAHGMMLVHLLATKRAVITWPRCAAEAGNRAETQFHLCNRCSAPAGGMQLSNGKQLPCDEQQQQTLLRNECVRQPRT